jgi:multiple antibiotic resistance protein
MLELWLQAFATFFATISPVDCAVLFAVLTTSATERHRRRMAVKGAAIGTGLLVCFALFGGEILALLGVTLPAMRAAGGILLLLLAIDMVFARPAGISAPTAAETTEAEVRDDISVFPLATPLIAGPGALGAAVLLSSEANGEWMAELVVIAALLPVMALTLALLLIAARLHVFLGVTAQNVITRVVGILLTALAVQFVFDGISSSGLIPSARAGGAGLPAASTINTVDPSAFSR